MALQKLLRTVPAAPYSRPPPLHISVVTLKEQPRVVSWQFEDGNVRPSLTKNNTWAVISDGKSVSKITLYEAFASKVVSGQGYVIRGYTLRGQCPPYSINVTKDTMFFKSAPLDIPPELQEEAKKLIEPASPLSPLTEVSKAEGFISIQGEVVELSTIKKIQTGKDAVPLRTVTVKQDQTQVTLCLWREAALFPLQVGAQTRLTHLKGNHSTYGFRLQSTTFTALKDTTERQRVSVLGTWEINDRPGMLHLLVEGEKMYEIEESLWAPLQTLMIELPFFIWISVSGKRVLKAEVSDKAETTENN